MKLQEFRKRYPEYDTWSDSELADGLYQKYYSTKFDRQAFDELIGFEGAPPSPRNLQEPAPADQSTPPVETPGDQLNPQDYLAMEDPAPRKTFNEQEFQNWYGAWAAKTGIDPNPDNPAHKYDYRAAYMAGAEPAMDPGDGKYHWDSRFKADDHPNRFVSGTDTKTGQPMLHIAHQPGQFKYLDKFVETPTTLMPSHADPRTERLKGYDQALQERMRSYSPEAGAGGAGAIATLAASPPAMIAGGIAAGLRLIAEQDLEAASETFEEVMAQPAKFLYRKVKDPKTGQEVFEARNQQDVRLAGEVMKPFELLNKAATAAGDWAMEAAGGSEQAGEVGATVATLVEAGTLFGLPKLAGAIGKAPWVRRLTNRERGLMVQDIADMKKSGMTEGQIIREFKKKGNDKPFQDKLKAVRKAEKPAATKQAPKTEGKGKAATEIVEPAASQEVKAAPVKPKEPKKIEPASIADQVNEKAPGHAIKYDGEQDRTAINKPPLYQFTAYDGLAKGATITIETPTVEAVTAKIEEFIASRKKANPAPKPEDSKKYFEKILEIIKGKHKDADADMLKIEGWSHGNDNLNAMADQLMTRSESKALDPKFKIKLQFWARKLKKWALAPEAERKEIKSILGVDRPKVAKPEIEITGKEKKTVTVDMPKSEAKQLSVKEQRFYLEKEINAAIKAAPKDGYSKGFVTFKVPGDGEFTIVNKRSVLAEFKKSVFKALPKSGKFPGRKIHAAPKAKGPMPNRISGEGVAYYNEYKPRTKKPLIEADRQWYDNGWHITGSLMIKAPKKNKKPYQEGDPPNYKELIKEKTQPAKIVAVTHLGRADVKPNVHIKAKKGKGEVLVRAHFVDHILSHHPDAKPHISKGTMPMVLWKSKGKVVAVTAPIDPSTVSFKEFPKTPGEPYQPKAWKAEDKAPSGAAEAMAKDIKPKEKAVPSIKYVPIKDRRRISKLIKSIEKRLKVPIRQGKFRNKALGIFKPDAKIIRMKRANDLPVAVHETAHFFQELLGLPKRMPAEVRAMAYKGADNLSREGFAEFVRFYVTQPNRAKQGAPGFYKDFEKALADNTDIQNVLVELRQAWKEFQASPSVSKVGSFIVRGQSKKLHVSFNRIYSQAKDVLYPIKKAVQYLEGMTGKKLPETANPYIMARLLKGWTRQAEQFLKYQPFKYDKDGGVLFEGESLRKILEPVEAAGEMELLDIYLVAKRAVTDPRVASGFSHVLTRADFNQTVMELEPKFKKIGDKLQKYNDQLLVFLLDSGRISKDTFNAVKNKNPFYAPLYRVMDDVQQAKAGFGQKADSVFNPLKRLKGSARDILSPTESMLYNTYAMINASMRNKVGNALMSLAAAKGMGRFMDKVPFKMAPEKITKDDFLRLLAEYGKPERIETIRTSTKETSSALKGLGKEKASKKMEKVVLEALQNRGWSEAEASQIISRVKSSKSASETQDIITKTIEQTTVMMVKEELGFQDMPDQVISTFRPMIKAGPNEVIYYKKGKPQLYEITDKDLYNALSSIDQAGINGLIKILSYPARWLRAGATTFSPEFGSRNFFRDQLTAFVQSKYNFIPAYDFIRGIYHMMGKTKEWQRFNASGAAHAAIVSIDRTYLNKNLRELYKEFHKIKYLKNPLELIQRISEYSEEATRVGEFVKGQKKEGGSQDALLRSAMAAREVSLDFARQGGATAKSLNMLTAFWNARLEGLDKMARTFRDHPGRASAKAFVGITLPSIILWYLQKDDPYYNELPEWRRVLFWNMVFHNQDGSLKFILPIPKPFEYGIIFGSMPEALLDAHYKQNPELLKASLEKLFKAFDIVPIPTATVPMVEWYSNKSWFFDRPIVPRSKEDLDPVLQYGRRTSESVKLAAEIMDKVPGIREIASPAKIQNLIMGYTAGLGRLGLEGADWFLKQAGVTDPAQEKKKIIDWPGFRAFRVRMPSTSARSIEIFYARLSKMRREWQSKTERKGIRGYGISLDPEQKLKLGAPPELLLYERVASELSLLRKTAGVIVDSKKVSVDTKKNALDKIYWEMINKARAALKKPPIKDAK